jgi:hypothetical protein
MRAKPLMQRIFFTPARIRPEPKRGLKMVGIPGKSSSADGGIVALTSQGPKIGEDSRELSRSNAPATQSLPWKLSSNRRTNADFCDN